MDNNLEIYNRLREVPSEACRPITSGDLAGLTNITPQWRIETLTREFGPCGIGWIYDPPVYRFEKTDAGEVICFCSINLYYKYEGEWSRAIPGEGGNKFVTKSNDGFTVNDECCKMALTDALSTAAKMIGLAADIYYKDGRDGKYTERNGSGADLFSLGNPPVRPQPEAPALTTLPQNYASIVLNQPQNTAPIQHTMRDQPMPGQSIVDQKAVCSACNVEISSKVAEFSQRRYGRKLCLNCQKTANQPAPTSVNAAPINRADALSRVFPFGKYANRTLGEVIAIDRKTIEVYANDKDGRYRRDWPDFWSACKAVLA